VERKNIYLSIFKSMFSYFIHATVMQQQIQEQLEAVSCHSINCSKSMSSKRQTEAELEFVFSFSLIRVNFFLNWIRVGN